MTAEGPPLRALHALPFSRARLTLAAVLLLVQVTLAGGLLSAVGVRSFDVARNRVEDEAVRLAACALIIISIALLVPTLRALRRRGLELVVGEDGLYVRLGLGAAPIVMWEQVAAVRVQRVLGRVRVVFDLVEPGAFVARLPLTRRWLGRLRLALRQPLVQVNPRSLVRVDAEALRAAIDAARTAHRPNHLR